MHSRLAFALHLVLLAGCGGSTGGEVGASEPAGPLRLLSCSLGCAGFGNSFGCSVTSIHVNDEIVLSFDRPVDPTSVDALSFSIVQETGAQPLGVHALDTNDPRQVRFRPQLSFDSSGNPLFGLQHGSLYDITLQGAASGSASGAPVIRGADGSPNATHLSCRVATDLGIADARPGKPRVEVFFDVVTATDPATQEVLAIERTVLANGGVVLRDVYRNTRVTLVFDDLMNPATLVNPVTGEAQFLSVVIDADGNPQNATDQVPVAGTYSISLDQERLRTTVVFQPAIGLPSAGEDQERPRLIVVRLPEAIRDLGGNALANPRDVIGVPERLVFERVRIPITAEGNGEDFASTERRDRMRTGAFWGPDGLRAGSGGGSGRLGDLLATGGTLELNTDKQLFSGGPFIDNYDPLTGATAPDPASVLVEDGVFEFSSLLIRSGAILRIRGSRPARVFVRGEATIHGTIDVSGQDRPAFASHPCEPFPLPGVDFPCDSVALDEELLPYAGQRGGDGGPAGGSGGAGGDLPDADETLQSVFGIDNPNAVIELDGAAGVGIPIPDARNPAERVAGGGGGVHWPETFPSDWATVGDVKFEFTCSAHQAGSCGAGGGYATPGGAGVTRAVGLGLGFPLAPHSVGGDPGLLGINAAVRSLNPDLGYLRGGAGGGGGGSHVARSHTTLVFGNPFSCVNVPAGEQIINDFFQARSAGGGGGGGAVQLRAAHIQLNGVIDATGGAGGSRLPAPPGFPEFFHSRRENATAGGGGSGGAVLLEAPNLAVAGVPARIRVDGGVGGEGVGSGSSGGQGGAGFVRVESGGGAGEPADFDFLSTVISPDAEDLLFYPGNPAVDEVLSVAEWDASGDSPATISGAQSCWLRVSETTFAVDYLDDVGDHLGWDMTLRMSDRTEVSYRAPGAVIPGVSLEELWGSELGSSPIVVRFQGVRAIGPLADLCDVPAVLDGPLLAESLSPWVRHPHELSNFFGKPGLRPNLIRFAVLFDAGHEFADSVDAVARLVIDGQPE